MTRLQIRKFCTAACLFLSALVSPFGAPAQETSHTLADKSTAVRMEDGVKVERLAEGFGFPEGPVWHPEGYLVFSDIHAGTIYKLLPAGGAEAWVIFTPPRSTNGLGLSKDKRKLYGCGHGELAFLEIDLKTRAVRILSPNFQGRPYQHVNDVAVSLGGRVYFTDPKWGAKPGDIQGVYQVDPKDGTTTLAAELDQQPNGITISPDQQWLYVARSGAGEIYRYRLQADGTLTDGTSWAKLEPKAVPDGITVDEAGHIYVAQANDGRVAVVSPEGKLLRHIKVFNRMCTNVEFENAGDGGIGDGCVLYATGGGGKNEKTGAVYRLTFPVEQ